MLTAARFQQHCAQLVDPSITNEARKDLATEVRDSIELVHSQDYNSFLAHFLPAFKTVLSVLTKPQLVDNTVHQTRAVILEILNRLPHNDVLRSRFLEVFTLAMDILQGDNEENAVTAIHIIFDLHKNFRHHLGGQVQPFLDFVRHLYESFGNTVKALLLVKRPPEQAGQSTPRRMAISSQSFKVMTECPLLVMFVFQLYPTFIKTNIQHLLPLMLRAIEVEIPGQAIAMSPKTVFQEFIAAQVKTVSFLAYLLKQFPELMKADEMSIPRSVVKLLQSCPGESVLIRKELLVATRHILGSPFRRGFFGQIDLLLEPRILVGTGRGAAETLRPLAYSFLAELVHCVRLNLSIAQLEKIISMFSTNLHDPTFTYTLQTSAVRLLLNLIEGILKLEDGDSTRITAAPELLLRILETMVTKYVTLGAQVPRLLKSVEELRSRPDPITSGKRLCEMELGDPMKEIADFKTLLKTLTLGLKTLIWSAIRIRVSHPGASKTPLPPGPTSEKGSSATQPNVPAPSKPGSRMGLFEKECEIVARLLGAGRDCFRLYSQVEEAKGSSHDSPARSTLAPADTDRERPLQHIRSVDTVSEVPFHWSTPRLVVASVQEEKEMFDHFAQIFTVLDIRSFQDVFGLRMDDLFEHIVENPAALMIPQHFLANSNISKYFADILLNFLVENLPIFDVALPRSATELSREEKVARSFLKLFKILFASVTLFPTNEPVLRLHIGTIVRKCLSFAAKARDPHNYLQMLRALFKTLTTNKSEIQFELLYRDFMPLVEPLFTGLLALYQGPNRLAHSELIVELCLMIPARPSTIFPYLDLQIKPIVWALEGGRENVHYGLRTLEFWVDMLQPGYLETLLARVEPELTKALYRLLRPPSSGAFGATSLRILGKLGSRARCNTALKMPFETNAVSEPAQQMRMSWPDGSVIMLQTDALIRLSADALLDKRLVGAGYATTEHKVQAWRFLFLCLGPFLGAGKIYNAEVLRSSGSDAGESLWSLGGAVNLARIEGANVGKNQRVRRRMRYTKVPEAKLVKKLLISLIGAAGMSELGKPVPQDLYSIEGIRKPEERIADMSRYFALLTVQDCERKLLAVPASSSTTSHESSEDQEQQLLSHFVFLDAITDVLSLEDRTFCNGGLKSLASYVSALFDFSLTSKSDDEHTVPDAPAKADEVSSRGAGHAALGGVEGKESKGGERMPSTRKASGDAPLQTKQDIMDIDVVNKDASSSSNVQSTEQKEARMSDVVAEDSMAGEVLENSSQVLKDEHVLAASLAPLVDRLCHCCYQRSWNAKWAGANGLGVIVNRLPEEMFPSPFFASNHIQIIRALLFVIRDSSEAVGDETVEQGRAILHKLLRMCFARKGNADAAAKPVPSPLSKVLREATVRLTVDLICDSASARETARQCLRILGDTLGCKVADLLTPVKEQLLRPLQQRSIRQHQFPIQIGYIEAIIFCLQLERPILSSELFSSPLRNLLLSEVITMSEDPTIEKLTEAEEGIRHKLVENKLIQTVVVKHLVRLRRRAVDLLCNIAIHCSSFLQEPANDDLFRRIISSFFKNLQSKDSEIVESAKRGLKQAVSKHQKPKEPLQQNLRPILGNLADYKKLSIQYLQGLSRVLELFSHWFNVNLGEKLLEHLQKWTEPEKLAQLKRWAPGTEARVGAAILDLFHLLPPAASKFLEKIVYMVIRLESVLAVAGPGVAHLGLKSAKAASTSPYRAPLLKYCNQHAAAAAKFFLLNINNEMMRQLFFVMIRSTQSKALRMELMDNPKRLVSPTYLSVEGMGSKSLHVITLIDLLSRHNAEWLGMDPDLMIKLSTYWKTASSFSELHQNCFSSLGRVQEVKTTAEIFIRYCTHFPKEINTLFDLLPVFSTRTSCDFTFVKDFLKRSVTKAGLCTSRRAVIAKFLSLFQDKSHSQERKVHALQYIVTPMIAFHLAERKELQERSLPKRRDKRKNQAGESEKTAAQAGSADGAGTPDKYPSIADFREQAGSNTHKDLHKASADNRAVAKSGSADIDTALSSVSGRPGTAQERVDVKDGHPSIAPDVVLDATMIQRIMKELLDQPDEVLRNYDEPLSAELLRLATILIKYMPTELGRYRKELIKFGWNHLKREDSIAKQWAFVNVSRFFEAYHAPRKIILQVYVALLRACQVDGKDLVQQALDILTPALPRRLIHNPNEHKYPMWIRYTKKILLEEGHSIPNLVHIWQLIARHSTLFYVARAQFVPIMVNSLSRIGLNATAVAENRRLALDLVDLIIKWEQTRRANREENSGGADLDAGKGAQNDGSRKRPRDESQRKDTVSNGSEKAGSAEELVKNGGSSAEPPAKVMKSSDAQAIPVSSSPSRPGGGMASREAEDFKPTAAMVDILVNFLVQIPFRPMDRREGPLVTKKCVNLLKDALELWPDATVRLAFVEKLLAPPVGEKVASVLQQSLANKTSASPATLDGAGSDGKSVSKNENHRNEKAEHARLKRNASRFAALPTALGLMRVLTKSQGRRFVEGNIGAVRSLVLPSITESVIPTAAQFASLLKELILVCPFSHSNIASKSAPSQKTPASSEATAKVDSVTTKSSGAAALNNATQGSEISSKHSHQSSDLVAKHVYKLVHEAIQVCVKASDTVANQCGLLVLKAFSSSAPQEFVKYQELLAKSLHRMTKENLSSSQQSAVVAGGASSTGAASSGGNRPGVPTDRNATNSSVPTPARAPNSSNAVGTESSQPQDTRPGKPQGEEDPTQKSSETQALILCISLLGDNIMTLETGQRKTLFHLLWALIDRCLQVEVLLEIVRVVGSWVLWNPREKSTGVQKEPLSSKEKVHFLLKMVVFERIVGKGSQELMKAYLSIILKIFGGDERRPELLPKLERAFMLGMKAADPSTRQKFFRIYDDSLPPSLPVRLHYVLGKQEWEYLADTLWISHATEFLLAAADKKGQLQSGEGAVFPPLVPARLESVGGELVMIARANRGRKLRVGAARLVVDQPLRSFCHFLEGIDVGSFVCALRALLHHDSELAYQAWVDLVPKTWATLNASDRNNMEKAIPQLLTKEYHQVQAPWPRNNIQALLDSIVECIPLPPLRAELIFHLGSRWNVWHTALRYLERRESNLRSRCKSAPGTSDDKPSNKTRAELEDIADAQAELYRLLRERDYVAGMWKLRAKSPVTSKAITYEQLGQYAHAQDVYSAAMAGQLPASEGNIQFNKLDRPGRAEVCFWEERWVQCARMLCQWDVLTEFSRVVVNSELLHECLWRVPDWSALKELLIKNPVEDGPQLKLYQAYVQLQENKLELADSFIMQGYQRALERYCALPDSADLDASGPILVQFQQLVELQESGRILGELNALSRHGSGSINVEQKIDNVRLILNTWRERLPSQHEPLSVWNDVLTWRNHVHAVVVNVLEALKEAASAKVAAAQSSSTGGVSGNRTHGNGLGAQTPQVQAAAAIAQALPQQVLVMGVNETAWNVHRFAKACRKQGFPDMALYALQKLYPFGTMELTEYFVKTKETARSFMSNPKGLENGTEYGLHELNRCNMDHFNARQKAQLFTVKGKLCSDLGRDDDAIEAYSIALSTSSDVGSAWLAWGIHCDKLQEKLLIRKGPEDASSVDKKMDLESPALAHEAGLEWREAAVNCFLQAARFGSRKARTYLPRVLRLLTLDMQAHLDLEANNNDDTSGEQSRNTNKATSNTLLNDNGVLQNASGASVSEAERGNLLPKAAKPSHGVGSRTPDQLGKSSVLNQSLLKEGVARVMGNLLADIPSWMWLPWLPQVVLMLGRKEGIIVRPILVRVAQQYPQAAFFPIRAYMEERKTIDRPDKHLTKEALKMGRPITPTLLPAASAAQVNAARQTQLAKDNLHRAQQRFHLIQKGLQRIDEAIAASQGSADQSVQIAKKTQLKEELMNAHRLLEKCVRDLQAAQQRQRQVLDSATSIQGSGASAQAVNSRKQTDNLAKSQTGEQQQARNQLSSGAVVAAMATERRTSSGTSVRHDGAESTLKRGSVASVNDAVQGVGSETMHSSGSAVSDSPFGYADYVMAHIVKSHQLLYVEIERIALDLSFRMKLQREEHLLSLMNALLHRCYQYSMKIGREVAPSFRGALEEVSRMCFGTGVDARERLADQRAQLSIADLKDAFEAELAPQTAKNFPTQIEPFIARLRRWQGILQRRVEAMPECLKLESLSRHLIEVNESDVEVFGQYVDVEISEPNPERHAKIERFSADVRVIRRQSGPSRGIQIIGSDGKAYDFVLETSINSNVQSTEDRTAQIYRLFNSFIFAKDSEAYRRRVQLTAPTFVATGSRTRLVSDDPSFSSLAEGLEQYLELNQKTFDDPLMAFRSLESEAYSRRRAGVAEESSRAESIAARVEAYHAVCDSHVPDTCLSTWVKSKMPTANSDFIFRKRFAETLGPASLVSYSLAIGARRPQNIMFSWSTGAIYNLHMRGLVSNRGILECDEAVPFRLTRNMRRVLGPCGLEGPFYGSMATTLQAFSNNYDILRLFLDVILRDELMGWSTTKSDSARSRSNLGSSDRDVMSSGNDFKILENRLSASVDAVVNRLRLSTHTKNTDANHLDAHMDSEMIPDSIGMLISKASKPENLAQMESSWQAWY